MFVVSFFFHRRIRSFFIFIHRIRAYLLRTADSLQLAAALIACEEKPQTLPFICNNARLREAAAKEGFHVLP